MRITEPKWATTNTIEGQNGVFCGSTISELLKFAKGDDSLYRPLGENNIIVDPYLKRVYIVEDCKGLITNIWVTDIEQVG